VARYSQFWCTPVLSTGAVAHDFGFNKKKEYPLLTRIGVTFDSLSRCIRDTMNYYNWTNVKVFLLQMLVLTNLLAHNID
jgi:hypothetical protein